jgi:hypothetical protein
VNNKESEMTVLAKMNDKVVEIVKVQRDVAFSPQKNWILICAEPAKKSSTAVRWVPATTRFEWVREFKFGFEFG